VQSKNLHRAAESRSFGPIPIPLINPWFPDRRQQIRHFALRCGSTALAALHKIFENFHATSGPFVRPVVSGDPGAGEPTQDHARMGQRMQIRTLARHLLPAAVAMAAPPAAPSARILRRENGTMTSFSAGLAVSPDLRSGETQDEDQVLAQSPDRAAMSRESEIETVSSLSRLPGDFSERTESRPSSAGEVLRGTRRGRGVRPTLLNCIPSSSAGAMVAPGRYPSMPAFGWPSASQLVLQESRQLRRHPLPEAVRSDRCRVTLVSP